MTQPGGVEIASIPGDDASSRVVVCLKSTTAGTIFALQRQSYGQDVGWFVQSEIEVSRTEMSAIRSLIGLAECKSKDAGRWANVADEPFDVIKFPTAAAS